MGGPSRWFVHRGNRAFTWLWWSQSISLFGSQISLIAIPAIAIIVLRVPIGEYALLTVVETLPYLVFSIPAGQIADRYDRRLLLIGANAIRAMLLTGLMVAAVLGGLSMPLLYVVGFAVGLVSVIFDVALQSYVPEILPPEELLAGNQRLEISESAARVVGPTAAAAFVGLVGPTAALLGDAVSYVAGGAALLGARRRQRAEQRLRNEADGTSLATDRTHSEDDALERVVDLAAALERRVEELERRLESRPRAPWHLDAWAGFRLVFADRALRDMAASTAIFNLASAAILAVLPLYVWRTLDLSIGDYGVLISVGNIGFVVGALTVGAVTARLGVGATLVAAAILGAVATVLLPLAAGALAVAFILAGRFIGAFAVPLYNVNARALRQSRAPQEAQGRVIAVFRLIDFGTLPIGAILAGVVGQVFGLHAVLVVGGLLGVLSAAWLVWSPVRAIRRIGSDASPAAPEPAPHRWEMPPQPTSPQVAERRTLGPAGSVGWALSVTGRIPTIRWAWLAVAGVALQLSLVVPVVNRLVGDAAAGVYVVSSALVLVCVLRNLAVPGLALIALGGASNLIAIVANGGRMPVSPEAARAVGHTAASGYTNTIELANAALKPLTDIIVVPPPLPLANVYSVGDLAIVIGLVVTIASAIHGRVSAAGSNPGTASFGTSAS